MSSSKSNLSNESSRSNLLTLSEDSQSELKSRRANAYYKKFISKLGFLFRIDTQDLDTLYLKIVQCVQEGQGFTASDDADINQLIEIAKQLKHNHSLLKNMVEVLDHRFLRHTPPIKKQTLQHFNHPKPEPSPLITKQLKFETPPFKANMALLTQQQRENENDADHDYGKLFDKTLHQAKEEVRKKKQAEANRFQLTHNEGGSQNEPTNIMPYSNKLQLGQLGDSKYAERVRKIFEGVNQIKGELQKMETSENNNSVYEEQEQLDPRVDSKKTTQSLVVENPFNQDECHQTFKQVRDDQYCLIDDRYLPQEPIPSFSKLSLKDLYSRMDAGHQGSLHQTTAPINSFHETTNFGPDDSLKYRRDLRSDDAQQYEAQLAKGQVVNNNSTEVGNSTLQNSTHDLDNKLQCNLLPRHYENFSEASEVIPNRIQNEVRAHHKLGGELDRNGRTNTSIIELNGHTCADQSNLKKRTDTMGSISTTNLPSSLEYLPLAANGRKQMYYEELRQKNEKSREKINSQLERLEERNKAIKTYVEKIQLNLKREKQLREQIDVRSSQAKDILSNQTKSLSNLIYTDYETITPKYLPQQKLQKGASVASKDLQFHSAGLQEANPNKIGSSFSPDINSYTRKQLESFELIQRAHPGLAGHQAPIVPALYNLRENEEQKSAEPEPMISHFPKKMNQAESASMFKHPHSSQKSDKMEQGQIPFQKGSLQIGSKNSMNSIEERLSQGNQIPSSTNLSRQFAIAKMTNHSLFEQTRSVQSKIELSEDRSYKMRVPGEEIEKIKERVNEMFKKMKSIRDETSEPFPDPLSAKEGQNSLINQSSAHFLENSSNQYGNNSGSKATPKFEFTTTTGERKQKLEGEVSNSRKQSSFIDNINQSKESIEQTQNPISANSFPFNPISKAKQSPVRLSFVYESPNKGGGLENQKNQNLLNSRDSNFSFRNPIHFFGQDSVRSSLAGFNPQHGTNIHSRFSRAQSVTSAQQAGNPVMQTKFGIAPVPILRQRPIRPASQSKSNSAEPKNARLQILRNPLPPPLPPRTQDVAVFRSPLSFKPPPKPTHISNQFVAANRPVEGHQHPKLTSQVKSPEARPLRPAFQAKQLHRNFSEATMAQSVVTAYSNRIPHPNVRNHGWNLAASEAPVSPRNKMGIKVESSRNSNTMMESSRNSEKSTSRSRSRKGISVVSDRRKERQA